MDSLYPEKCRACDCIDMTMNTNSPQPLILHTFDTGKTVPGYDILQLVMLKPGQTSLYSWNGNWVFWWDATVYHTSCLPINMCHICETTDNKTTFWWWNIYNWQIFLVQSHTIQILHAVEKGNSWVSHASFSRWKWRHRKETSYDIDSLLCQRGGYRPLQRFKMSCFQSPVCPNHQGHYWLCLVSPAFWSL